MKNLLPFIFCAFFLPTYSQVNSSMPAEAHLFYQKAMEVLQPEIRRKVESIAKKLEGRTVNADSLSMEIKKDIVFKKQKSIKMEAITILILVQASRNADADLKEMVINMANEKDTSSRAFNKTKPLLEYKSALAKNLDETLVKMNSSPGKLLEGLSQ